MKRATLLFALVVIFGTVRAAVALIIPSDKGLWPATWPKELEPLRSRSKTLDVATGIQEHIYTIPFADRDEFEKLWPVLMKLRTPGSPLTLSKVGMSDPNWNKFVPNDKPAVRIKGPTGGYAGGANAPAGNGSQDIQKAIETGILIHAAAPWPKELAGPNGELPEYVVATPLDNGKLTWKSVADINDPLGFQNRARVDIELIIDGTVIDLNRIALPQDARLVDRRFANAPDSSQK